MGTSFPLCCLAHVPSHFLEQCNVHFALKTPCSPPTHKALPGHERAFPLSLSSGVADI